MHKDYSLPILLYDDKCNLCNRFKLALDKIEGSEKINTITIHDQNLYEIFTQITYEECNETLHLIDENENVLRGSEALEYLIGKFPAVSKFSWLYESNMGKKAIDLFYKVADNYRKSSLNHCKGCKRTRHL